MTNQDLLDHVRDVAEKLGHQPSAAEFEQYGSVPVSKLEEHFNTYQQAIEKAELDLPTDRPVQGPLDEPPDTSGKIPSHTDLLRELRYLVERKGSTEAQSQFGTIGAFDTEHYDIQFGSVSQAFDLLFELRNLGTRNQEYVPRRSLVDELNQFGEFLQRAPTLLELLYYSSNPFEKYVEKFDSLAAIHAAAEFPRKTVQPSNADLFDDIRGVVDELERPPTVEEYADRGEFDYVHAIRRFDGWIPSLNAAGYDLLWNAPSLDRYRTPEDDRIRFNTKLRLQTGLGVEEILLDDLYRLQHQFPEPISNDLVNEYSRYPSTVYDSVFGSVDNAITASGGSPADENVDSKNIDRALQSALVDVATRLGREPSREEVDGLGQYIGITYLSRFGSWESALDTCNIPSTFESQNPETPYALLWELDRIATDVGHSPRLGTLHAKSQYDSDRYLDVFGSWETVYETAGYDWDGGNKLNDEIINQNHDSDKNLVTDYSTSDTNPSPEALLNELTRLDKNWSQITRELLDSVSDYDPEQYTDEFGSLDTALAEAGIHDDETAETESGTRIEHADSSPTKQQTRDESPSQNQPEPELTGDGVKLLEELRRLDQEWSEIDRKLLYSVSDHHPDEYEDAFGSVDAALIEAGIKEPASTDHAPTSNTNQSQPSENQTNTNTTPTPHPDADQPTTDDQPTTTSQEISLPDGRVDTLTVTVLDHDPDPGPRRDALLQVELQNGTEIPLNIWKSHNPSLDWTVGDTYTITQVQHKSWKMSTGTEQHELSSTQNFDATQTSSDPTSSTPSSSTTSQTKKNRSNGTKRILKGSSGTPSRGELLTAIQHVAETTNRPLKASDIRDSTEYAVNDITRVFGSWQNALSAAGIDNKARLIDDLHRVADKLGRQPTTTEMNEHGHVTATTYATYFGTYTAARDQAFDETQTAISTTDTDNTNLSKSKLADTTGSEANTSDEGTKISSDDSLVEEIMNDLDEL